MWKIFLVFVAIVVSAVVGANFMEFITPEKYAFVKPEYLNLISLNEVPFYLMVGLLGLSLLFAFTISYREKLKRKDVTSVRDLQISNLQGIAESYEGEISELKKDRDAYENEASRLRYEVEELKSDPDRITKVIGDLEKATKGVKENRDFIDSIKKVSSDNANQLKTFMDSLLTVPGVSDLVDIDSLNKINSSQIVPFTDNLEMIDNIEGIISEMTNFNFESNFEKLLLDTLLSENERLGTNNKDFMLIAWAFCYIIEDSKNGSIASLATNLRKNVAIFIPEIKKEKRYDY